MVRLDLKGENEKILVTENVQDFQVCDDKIYYINHHNQICQIDSSGKNASVLKDSVMASKIQVIGQWIYYYDQTENALFRLKNNGKKQELVSTLVNNEIYNVCGKYVYYLDRENSRDC